MLQRFRFGLLVLVLMLGALHVDADVRTYFWRVFDTSSDPSAPIPNYFIADTAVELSSITTAVAGDVGFGLDDSLVYVYDGASWSAVGGGGGAPITATYITQTANGILSNEQAMSLTGTGLVFNTFGTGVLSQYAGSGCAGTDKATGISSAGALTCSAVAYGNVTGTPAVPTGTGFSHVTAGSLDAASVLLEFTNAAHVKSNQGTTTTVLHGNAAGQASFGAVALATDVSGALGVANGGAGFDISAQTGLGYMFGGVFGFATTSNQIRTLITDDIGTGPMLFGFHASAADDLGCTGSQVVRRNSGDTAFECATLASSNTMLASDYTNSTATFSNTALSRDVIAGQSYTFTINAFVSASVSANGVKFDFDGSTATATNFRVHCTLIDTALLLSTQVTALATDMAQATLAGAARLDCAGTIEPSGSGTLVLRAARNSGIMGTITIARGSFMWLERI